MHTLTTSHPARSASLLLLLLAAACRLAAPQPARGTADTVAIRKDVAHLASDALEGRGSGTAGNDSAAAYIARRFSDLGLRPLCFAERPTTAACDRAWLQPFTARSVAAAHAGLPSELRTQNVVAMLPGNDPSLRGEYVVIGAHFDHLGRQSFGALDPDSGSAIRNGADDNASGTVAVLEMARLLAARPPRRSVVFVTFSGEELGLLGSRHFVGRSPVPVDSIVAMLNFDMVGRLRDDKLIVYGTGTAAELPAVLDSANAEPRLSIRAVPDGFGPSDHSSFYVKGIPVLHFFTDLHGDYHRATDDAHKVNVAGTARVIDYAERVVRRIADAPDRLTPVRGAPRAPASSGRGYGAYFGSIPDMGAADVQGVRVSGVRAGSPADSAGVREGDVLVEFAGKVIRDLYEFTDVLREHKPGDVVDVVVERDGRRVTLRARLGTRG